MTTELALTRVGTHGRSVVILGLRAGRVEQLWDREHAPFLQVSGPTRAGKSVCIRCVEVHDLRTGNIGVSLETKPDDAWASGAISRAITPPGWLKGLTWVVGQLNDRIATCEVAGVPMISLVDPDTPWITVYVHEFPALVGEESLLDFDKDQREEAVKLVTRIVKVGGAMRVGMVVGTQDPTVVGTFGRHPSGAAIRRNFVARAHFDDDTDSIRAAFDGLISQATLRQLEVPHKGRCGALHLHPDDGDKAVAAQIWHIELDHARPFAAAWAGPEAIDFDARSRPKVFHP